MRRAIAVCLALAFSFSPAALAYTPDQGTRPNVLVIVLDDLNDHVGFLGGHPQTRTPHMDSLAARSTSFTDAYPTIPVCAPSRASMFSGIQPYRSRNMDFVEWFKNPALANSRTLMEHFRANGYSTMGVGKILHHNKREIWSEFHGTVDYGPVWIDNGKVGSHPSSPQPFGNIGAIDGSFAAMNADGVIDRDGQPYTGWWSAPDKSKVAYRSASDRDPLPDEKSVQWAARRIAELDRQGDHKPFFLAVGILKPHTPLHVPEKYFARIAPEAEIVIPNFDPDDADDTHYRDVFDETARGRLMFRELGRSFSDQKAGLRAFIRAYLAAVAFADDQVGILLQAVAASRFADNTIIVLTSDHGWSNGEKDVLYKNNLWQSGSRVPLLIYRPGHTPAVRDAPVSQIDLYPTLVDLAGLTGDTRKSGEGIPLDGRSLVPYLDGNAGAAPPFVLAMLKATNSQGRNSDEPRDQHFSVVTRSWRYIRYNTGQQELYDRQRDPLERHNLAREPSMAAVRHELGTVMDAAINEPATVSSGRR